MVLFHHSSSVANPWLRHLHVVAVAVMLAMMSLVGNGAFAAGEIGDSPTRMVLVGASIGRNWHIDQLTKRTQVPGNYRFEYLGVNAFDKTPLIQAIESRTEKPQAVLLKECATYFPGDLAAFQAHEKAWVKSLRDAGIQPILVTTAPVAEPKEMLPKFKNWVKQIIGKPTWQGSVLQFNDWLKAYAASEGLEVFDLEAALRRSAEDRWLRDEFDNGDGMHLNSTAYQAVDKAFVAFLAARQKGQAK